MLSDGVHSFKLVIRHRVGSDFIGCMHLRLRCHLRRVPYTQEYGFLSVCACLLLRVFKEKSVPVRKKEKVLD